MGRPTLTIILGVLLTLVIAAFLWNGIYAATALLRAGDKSVFVQLVNEDLLASARHAWAGHFQTTTQVNAGVAAALALLGAGVLAGIAMRRRASPLGDAAFMRADEAAAAGFFQPTGMFFGRLGGTTLTWPTTKRDPGSGRKDRVLGMRLLGGRYLKHPTIVHAFIAGPTRSGKGAALIIPNCLMWPHSVLVLDIRGETFNTTAGYRSGFTKVFKFAPLQPETHGYNPLDFVRNKPGLRDADIMAIVLSLIPSTGSSDEYWVKDARELVAGVVSYVLESPRVPDKTIASVMDVVFGTTPVIDKLTEILGTEDGDLSPFTKATLLPFLEMSEKQFSGLYGNLRTAMRPYMNEYLRRATAFSSFDVRAFRRERMSLYVDFRLSQTKMMAPIVNLLISQIVDSLSETTMGPGEHPVLILLDEFSNLGRLEPILSMWKVLAGNGVGVWAFVQSLTDLDRLYGRDGRNTLLDNSDLQIFLGSQSSEVLAHFEGLLGNKTVVMRSRSQSGGFMAQHRSYSTHAREVAVPLMSKDELRRMSKRRFIVLPLGEKPIFARKNFFFADRFLMRFAHRPLPKTLKLPNIERGLGKSIFDRVPPARPSPTPAPGTASVVAGQSRARLKPGSVFLAQVGGTVHSIAPAPRQPGAAFRIGLARETRRGRTAAGDERAASLEETASASPAGGNVVAFRTGPQADVGASERAGADVTAHPEIGKKRHERPLENEAGAVGDEPDDEVLARIVGAADGQAIPPQALAGSANIVDLKRAGGRRHSAGPGGPPRAESERPHPPTLTAHDRSLDKTAVDRTRHRV